MDTVVFYDIKEYEKEYFNEELKSKYKIIYRENSAEAEQSLSKEESEAEIISVFTATCMTAEIIKRYKKLKLILTRSVGYSHIDIGYCKKHGIIVANTPHYGDYTVAEYSFGLLLNLVRRICFGSNALKNGEIYSGSFGMELYNKTIGIIGTGAIGSKSVKIAKGFSMNVLCCDIRENEKLKKEYEVEYVTLETLCKKSEVILIQIPLTDKTYHLIDREKLGLMNKNTVIVNTARGEIIDTEALYEFLSEKRIRGAALDVLEFEDMISQKAPGANIDIKKLRISLINNKLTNLKNVTVTPHIAYDTKEATERISEMTVINLSEYYAGKELSNKVY